MVRAQGVDAAVFLRREVPGVRLKLAMNHYIGRAFPTAPADCQSLCGQDVHASTSFRNVSPTSLAIIGPAVVHIYCLHPCSSLLRLLLTPLIHSTHNVGQLQ